MEQSTALPYRPGPAWPLVTTGIACGTAWAASLRGWMIQIAGPGGSTFTWYGPFGLVIAPGAVVGAAFGYAEYRRRTAGPRSRWLTFAPLVFLVALTVPWIFVSLITNGLGGGAIGVTAAGLAGGYALSGRGRAWTRCSSGALAVLGVLMMAVMAGDVAPLGTARGVWVGSLAASLMALLCLACAIPQRIGRPAALPAWLARRCRRAGRGGLVRRAARVHVCDGQGPGPRGRRWRPGLRPAARDDDRRRHRLGRVAAARWSGPAPVSTVGAVGAHAVHRGPLSEARRPGPRLRRWRRAFRGRRPRHLHDRWLRLLRTRTALAPRPLPARAGRMRARMGRHRRSRRWTGHGPDHPPRRLGRRPVLVTAAHVLDRCRTTPPPTGRTGAGRLHRLAAHTKTSHTGARTSPSASSGRRRTRSARPSAWTRRRSAPRGRGPREAPGTP